MEWIDVNRDLPPKKTNESYLVVIEYITGKEQMVVEWWFNGVDTWQWIPNIDGSIQYIVTHWKLLDELP